MPTSSSARMLGPPSKPAGEARAFVYRPARPVSPANGTAESGGATSAGESAEALWWKASHAERVAEEETLEREKKAREQGFHEGLGRARAEYAASLAAERVHVAEAIERFANAQKHYFQQVEPEIVRLALSIARKILHREAQIDPLLLAGIVRVALEKVATGSGVRLRVPESEVSKWLEVIATQSRLDPPPEVVPDPLLGPAQCLLETEVGTTDLSLETQLEEIEKGFLDILALRPRSTDE